MRQADTKILATFEVCLDCYQLEGTGDPSFLDGHYQGEEADARLAAITAGMESMIDLEGADYITVGDDISEFSSSPCECCGESLAGSRHELHVMGSAKPAPVIKSSKAGDGCTVVTFEWGSTTSTRR